MCTLSVIPRQDGFLIGMNRDEHLSRVAAESPRLAELDAATALYPQDSKGGTWVALSNRRIALALLNRNETPRRAPGEQRESSRGFLIPELIGLPSLAAIERRLKELPLDRLPPFCLVGVASAERGIVEWNWRAGQVQRVVHRWEPRHWYSSGLSDRRAEAERGSVCQRAWLEDDAGSAAWLRRLHASHENGPGPFSICVHREQIRTLSYTELHCDSAAVRLSYFPESPCTRTEESAEFSWEMAAT
jgi:hypothetical protein